MTVSLGLKGALSDTVPVAIAGGGIGGLTLALTLHQIGVDCVILEAVGDMRPLGVGINLQPNAVRELFDLGIDQEQLDEIGTEALEWALVGLNGNEIHAEPRGRSAGYNWPQYGVHRGALHKLLYQEVLKRLGPDAVHLGQKVTGFEENACGVKVLVETRDGKTLSLNAGVLVGADGIHSAVREQMHPNQPPIHWGGAIMWRGTVRAKPLRTGASFVGLGTDRRRMVMYPISRPAKDGHALINWIAEVTVDCAEEWPGEGWFRPASLADFICNFEDFRYDWLDVPTFLQGADCVYENPMIDRDPVPTWVQGSVALIGDAAHAMYPTGSNGASQAIVDARVLGAKMVKHGVTALALDAYNAELCAPISELVLRNRSAGPFGLLTLVSDRCGGVFGDIDTVIPKQERQDFIANYKIAAGLAVETLNASPPTISPGETAKR